MAFEMKNYFITLFICLSFFCNSQNLEYSRVIDTILTVNITSPTSLTQDILGDFVSPANGKVWKINNIMISSSHLGDYVRYCSGTNTFSSSGSHVKLGLLFSDGSNEICLCTKSMKDFIDPNDFIYHYPYEDADNCVSDTHYPMWINSSSKLTAFISSYTSISIANPDDICLNNTIGKIRIMAIEFKE